MATFSSEVGFKEVNFPPSASVPDQSTSLLVKTSIVVVGANGAGKSRLGTWLEFKGPQKERVHRIAAQRSLVFPESVSPIGYQSAQNAFYWAPMPANWDEKMFENNKASMRIQTRYGGSLINADTAPLNDFNALVTLLFSENYSALLAHEEQQRASASLVPMPDTNLRKVQRLWEELLPNRAIRFKSGEVRVAPRSALDKEYAARAMSDGERVVFYLIGQCLCAPTDAIIVVDEPEIHLHKAIQDALWTSLEKERQDCTFVYLTHDLAFAADRTDAVKVCVTKYEAEKFSWFAVGAQDDIPEDVFLEMLGSRKPVLFVEGARGSLDVALYRAAFPKFTVKPVGSCAAVVATTKVFRSLEDMHHIKSFGIVDRDYLEQGQIDAYERSGIFVPKVAEVENLVLIPELVKAVASQLVMDPEAVLVEVTKFVLEDFARWLPTHAMEKTRHNIALLLGRFSSDHPDVSQFVSEFTSFKNGIDPMAVHAAALAEAQAAMASSDYTLVLRLFNKKELSKNMGRFFGITKGSYIDKINEMVRRDLGDVSTHLRRYLPDLEASL